MQNLQTQHSSPAQCSQFKTNRVNQSILFSLFLNLIKISIFLSDYQHTTLTDKQPNLFIFFMQSSLKQYPELRGFFDFPQFNAVQLQCLPKIMKSEANMIVSAPTSSGKTVIFQLAILKYSNLNSPICLYLAPIKSLCHEKYNEWNRKFSKKLSVIEITGDSLQNNAQTFVKSHIAVGTPEKVDFLSRQSLEYLKNIRLLLIDQIHMLNFEERGATLQAIVSRIISLNSKVRIIAVSATIPNINQVGQWLRCPPSSICVFDQRYRPVPIRSVVLGFNNTGNPFNFQQTLNFKLLQVVRMYSEGRGSLIFCPTQKGTQHACEKIISQMKQRQFIQNDKQLLSLVQAAKQLSNSKLQSTIPMGIAFHHASLSYQDRNTIQKLFLQYKLKILCTTSTLAMGINLPARLVVIKSTQCYKGSMKGYMQYTRIEIEQMMGRAGRPPFDTQGTVVIMTQKQNYNRYNSKLQLQNLQSQLFGHMLQHINAEISLGSISSLQHLEEYFFNSFCYIRMKKDPHNYGVKGNVDSFIKQNCLKALKTLTDLLIVNFNQENGRVSPRPLSINISRNAVEIRSISRIFSSANRIQTSRQYLLSLCECEQIGKYTSKIEQRKLLKKLNENNIFQLKQAICTAERKAFVLTQTELSNRSIQYWQLRRQATQILILLKRLNNCIKNLGLQLKNFWLYYWAAKYNNFFTLKFWEYAKTNILTQFSGLRDKGKLLQSRNIQTINDLRNSLDKMQSWLNLSHNTIQNLQSQLQMFTQSLKITPIKEQNGSILLKIEAIDEFKSNYKGATVCIADKNNYLYYYKYLNNTIRQITVHFPKNNYQEYKVAILKQGIIGFDQFYLLKALKLTQYNPEQQQSIAKNGNRKSIEPKTNKLELSFENKKNNSLSIENKRKTNKKSIKIQYQIAKTKNVQRKELQNQQDTEIQQKIVQNIQHTVSTRPKQKQLLLPEKYRRKFIMSEQDKQNQSFLQKKIKKQQFYDLKNYNWKPGFEEFSNSQDSNKNIDGKKLKFVDSKQKNNRFNFAKLNDNINIKQKRQENIVANPKKLQTEQISQQSKKQSKAKLQHQDVFNYFYNLF